MASCEKTICVDFDGVISKYDHWLGKGKFGPPVSGCSVNLFRLSRAGWKIIIHTTRSEIEDVKKYLIEHNIPFDYINYNPENEAQDCSPIKPLATVYLDDRAIQFNGDWDRSVEETLVFEPYYRRKNKKEEMEMVAIGNSFVSNMLWWSLDNKFIGMIKERPDLLDIVPRPRGKKEQVVVLSKSRVSHYSATNGHLHAYRRKLRISDFVAMAKDSNHVVIMGFVQYLAGQNIVEKHTNESVLLFLHVVARFINVLFGIDVSAMVPTQEWFVAAWNQAIHNRCPTNDEELCRKYNVVMHMGGR